MGKARWYTEPSVPQPDTLEYSPDQSKIIRIMTLAEIPKCNIFLRTPCIYPLVFE